MCQKRDEKCLKLFIPTTLRWLTSAFQMLGGLGPSHSWIATTAHENPGKFATFMFWIRAGPSPWPGNPSFPTHRRQISVTRRQFCSLLCHLVSFVLLATLPTDSFAHPPPKCAKSQYPRDPKNKENSFVCRVSNCVSFGLCFRANMPQKCNSMEQHVANFTTILWKIMARVRTHTSWFFVPFLRFGAAFPPYMACFAWYIPSANRFSPPRPTLLFGFVPPFFFTLVRFAKSAQFADCEISDATH